MFGSCFDGVIPLLWVNHIQFILKLCEPSYNTVEPSGGYRGVAMVSAETPSENSAPPLLFMIRAGDNQFAIKRYT